MFGADPPLTGARTLFIIQKMPGDESKISIQVQNQIPLFEESEQVGAGDPETTFDGIMLIHFDISGCNRYFRGLRFAIILPSYLDNTHYSEIAWAQILSASRHFVSGRSRFRTALLTSQKKEISGDAVHIFAITFAILLHTSFFFIKYLDVVNDAHDNDDPHIKPYPGSDCRPQ